MGNTAEKSVANSVVNSGRILLRIGDAAILLSLLPMLCWRWAQAQWRIL